MNILKLLLIAVLSVLNLVSPAFAADTGSVIPVPPVTPVPPTPPAIENLPIGSVNQLRMWAAEQVTRGTASAWSPTAVEGKGGSYFTKPFTNGLDFIDATNWLNRMSITLGVYNSMDRVNTFASFENNDGYSLFYGDSQDSMFYETTGFVVRASIKIRLNDQIPLQVCGVRWANILERDDNGNVINWFDVRVYNQEYGFNCETIMFPSYFAGKRGDLVLNYADGRKAVLNLETGNARTARNVATQITANFLGAIGLRDTNVVFVAVSEDDYHSQRGTIVQLTLTQLTTVRFASWLPTGEKAYMLLIRKKALDTPTAIYIPPSSGFIDWSLPTGKYWIEFMYPSGFGEEDNEYNRPYNGGGGKG